MAKKKKTQLKPVSRGFATTSVPKKAVPVAEEPEAASVAENTEENTAAGEGVRISGNDGDTQAKTDEFDPDNVEEQSLQNLVDKFQDKTEKEIIRTVKAVEMDRRFSKTLPRLDLHPKLIDHILELSESDPAEVKGSIGEPEEKAVARLGITYGTLRRLGFSESRVEECLRSINGIELDEAYDWLWVHCTEEELDEKRNADVNDTRMPGTPRDGQKSQVPSTPRTPAQFLASPPTPTPTPFKVSSRLDANAAAFVPSPKPSSLSFPSEVDLEEEKADLKARTMASLDRSVSPSGSEPDASTSDSDDPNSKYVRLKMKISNLTTHRQPGDRTDSAFVRELQKQLEDVKGNYFFDEKDAELQFRDERKKADALALQSRLRGAGDANTEAAPKPAKRRPPKLQPKVTPEPAPESVSDIFDEDSIGGVFEMLEEMPATLTDAQGTTITVRDMALPKHWSGRTPKILLMESVAKFDRYAAITYHDISGSSRAKRAAVCIRWEGQKMGEWAMEDIACHDLTQAEQYIATIALHSLTFPSTDGFAAGTSTATGSQTFFRLLPAVFRDLWDELETKRKASDDAINRGVWAKLRSIVEPKLETVEKSNGKISKSQSEVKDVVTSRRTASGSDVSSDFIRDSFAARQNSFAYQEMLQQRNTLPIAQYRDEIIASLDQSQILVLSGETGCGKSTQVPAFILEDQLSRGLPCKIYCTEPRRISAISLAQRVSRELGDLPGAVGTLNSLVGYSIRLESNTTKNTRLAFVTNGIALRMLEGGTGHGGQGTAFDEITHIIIDEVHERTIESDFLLIVLKSLLEQRSDLKIILMSATVDAEKISNFFGGCPTLHIPGRTFPVDVQYLEDAVEYTKWTISENSPYARRLHDKFYRSKNRTDWTEETAPADDDDDDEAVHENVKLEKRYSAKTGSTINLLDERLIPYDLIVRLLERICFEDPAYASYSSAVLIFMPGMGEIRKLNDMLAEHPMFGGDDFRIYPLHSTLSSENQGAVFDIPPSGIRKIVIATNIAETGITIPDVTCVLDTGKHREMRFDEKRQISRLVETFVAKSNAAQRRGRAGRVQRGLCFHLFTKLRHDTLLADHPLPEMMRLSLSDLALRIKIMKIKIGSSIEDVLSRAMDPPASINIQRAISALVEVRALTPSEDITPMGRLLSKLPTDVHLGKFLLTAALFRCLDPALTIAAALNSKSPFITPFGHEQEADRAKSSFRVENSDFLTLHNAFASWRRASSNPGFVRKFCRLNFLSQQNLQQIEELRQQFLGYLIDTSFIQVDKSFIRELNRARYGRNRTRFVMVPPELDVNSSNPALVNAALAAGLYPKILSIDPANGQMRTITNNQPASFHPSSVNFRRKAADFGVNHLSYFTLMHSKKLYAWETSPVDDMAMLLLCGEADFKLVSNSAFIDRKIKFQISPKAGVALKHLRSQLASILAQQFRGKPLSESQVLWNETALSVLGKVKVDDEENESIVVVN
ncbi:hypothetical protein PLICRDRAFT_35442 [Plicaturopsis crispa FD-325 SS-3]|nr:hypothetical protein PLICRDRAFT_35442 [Plicaturopsis crispa FD-325 SS-3]